MALRQQGQGALNLIDDRPLQSRLFGVTLVASNQVGEDARARLERAIVDMDPEVIARTQPTFVAKTGQLCR